MKYILVFGSLRKYSSRGFNFNRFKAYGEQIFIRNLVLDGYEMYSLGAYPAICPGDGQIKCELHSIAEDAYNLIQQMEINAGYREDFVKLEGGITASIFTMPKERLLKFKVPKMESGDWN